MGHHIFLDAETKREDETDEQFVARHLPTVTEQMADTITLFRKGGERIMKDRAARPAENVRIKTKQENEAVVPCHSLEITHSGDLVLLTQSPEGDEVRAMFAAGQWLEVRCGES